SYPQQADEEHHYSLNPTSALSASKMINPICHAIKLSLKVHGVIESFSKVIKGRVSIRPCPGTNHDIIYTVTFLVGANRKRDAFIIAIHCSGRVRIIRRTKENFSLGAQLVAPIRNISAFRLPRGPSHNSYN